MDSCEVSIDGIDRRIVTFGFLDGSFAVVDMNSEEVLCFFTVSCFLSSCVCVCVCVE